MAMNHITPMSYRKGSSLLHKLPAGLKLVFLLLLSAAAFFPGPEKPGLAILSVIAVILIILSFAAGIGPAALLRGSGPLLLIVIAAFAVQGVEFSPFGFNTSGLSEALVFCARIALAFAAASLLFSVTTTGEIRKSLSRLEAILHFEKPRLSLHISLMLGFLKFFFEIWEDLNLAWKSRGGKNNFFRFLKLVPLLIEKMIIKAAETADALEARGAAF